MEQRPSGNIIKAFVVLLCGVVLTGLFLVLVSSLLVVTVDPLFLSLMMELLLALFVLSIASCLVLGFLWFLLLYRDERHKRSYWRERRERDLEEREQAPPSQQPYRSRFMHSGPHAAIRQMQVPSRRSKPPRFDY